MKLHVTSIVFGNLITASISRVSSICIRPTACGIKDQANYIVQLPFSLASAYIIIIITNIVIKTIHVYLV